MKRCTILIGMLLVIWARSALADGLNFEEGVNIFHSNHPTLTSLQYRLDTSPLFGLEAFCNFGFLTWNGPASDEAIMVLPEVRWNIQKSYLGAGIGGAFLSRNTANLGTHAEFVLRGEYGIHIVKHWDLSLGFDHISNGKNIFHWTSTSDAGENFITLRLGYSF